jgi:uncharacterized protein (DUF305 family)
MALVSEPDVREPDVHQPDVDQPGPPADVDEHRGGGGGGGGPWWHVPWKLLVMAVAVLFLGGAIGYTVATLGDTKPGAASVDVGFLQDMRWHHDQATQMSLTYLQKPATETDPVLRTMASAILLEQQLEAGAMVQLLHEYGQPEANQSGTGMAWMSQPVPIDQMPGMATPEQLAQLKAATGHAADTLYAQLMLDHHLGGIHMASYAAPRASESRVRQLAASMVTGQQSEISELQGILTRLNG